MKSLAFFSVFLSAMIEEGQCRSERRVIGLDSLLLPTSVTFKLFSRAKREGVDISTSSSSHFLRKEFNAKWETKFVIHGYLLTQEASPIKDTVSAYLDTKDYNMVTVSYTLALGLPNPFQLVDAPAVGKEVAKMIQRLLVAQVTTFPQMHLIGHSLGAQIAGLAGSILSSRIERITGLDPAGANFKYYSDKYRLDKSDAVFVDVIHTSAFMGFYDPIGHVNFYPNGGKEPQPGCETELLGFCSHFRAFYFYIESIKRPSAFKSVKCSSWEAFVHDFCYGFPESYMGAYVSSRARGLYYLSTNAEPPYSQS